MFSLGFEKLADLAARAETDNKVLAAAAGLGAAGLGAHSAAKAVGHHKNMRAAMTKNLQLHTSLTTLGDMAKKKKNPLDQQAIGFISKHLKSEIPATARMANASRGSRNSRAALAGLMFGSAAALGGYAMKKKKQEPIHEF